MKSMQGFTLIELMIVIAILGILLAIAIPAYQDYTIRAKVAEGMNLAAAAKLAVSEYRITNNQFPTSNPLAGYAGAKTLIVNSITVGAGGRVTIRYLAPTEILNKTLILTPSVDALGNVLWGCAPGTLAGKYAPSSCRP